MYPKQRQGSRAEKNPQEHQSSQTEGQQMVKGFRQGGNAERNNLRYTPLPKQEEGGSLLGTEVRSEELTETSQGTRESLMKVQ